MFGIVFGNSEGITTIFTTTRVWGDCPSRVYANAILIKKGYEYDNRFRIWKLAMSPAPVKQWSLAKVMPLENPEVHIGGAELKAAESGT